MWGSRGRASHILSLGTRWRQWSASHPSHFTPMNRTARIHCIVAVRPHSLSGHCGEENDLCLYRGADKSLARPTYRCILFDGDNISFDASPVIYT
jgi:hypothetical protein